MQRLPKEVEKQAQLAEEAFKKRYGTPPPEGEAPKPAEPSTPPTANETTVKDQSAPPAEPAKTEPDDQSALDNDINHWKQRAKVAEGRLSKEMPRMAQRIRELTEQLATANAKIEEMKTAPAAQPQNSGVKPEEVEQYGKDFIDMVERVARSQRPAVDEKLVEKVEQASERTLKLSREQFFAALTGQAPNWEKLNTDEGFLAYLAGMDPFTGRVRQELFDEAYAQLDSWRVANFFNNYADSLPKSTEPPRPSLADQVVPSGNRASAPPAGKKTWTTKEVARFYDDARRGTVYTQDEVARIEKDIFAAQREGRLR